MKKNGFTLIEMIISISIIAILASIVIATLNPFEQFKKASDARRKSDLSQIQKALEQYYQDHGSYPAHSTSGLTYRIVDSITIDWGKSWQPYINILPKDPTSTKRYIYYSTGQTYYLYASLDRGSKDPQVCAGVNNECANVPKVPVTLVKVKCGGSSDYCNYGVTTPDQTP